jgi:hypothetical protein
MQLATNTMKSTKNLNGNTSSGGGDSVNQTDVNTSISSATSAFATKDEIRTSISTATSAFSTKDEIDTTIATRTSAFATKNEIDTTIAERTTALVTAEQLTSTTTASAQLVANNQYTGINVFCGRTIFMDKVSLGSTAEITDNENEVFRELRLLRSHYTAPEWRNIALDPTNFTPSDYYPNGPQYCVIQYGTASHVSIRGVIGENNNYFTDTDNRFILNMPLGARPAARHMFLQPGGNNGQAGAFLINHNGDVTYLAGNSLVKEEGTTASFHLDGMNYWTN